MESSINPFTPSFGKVPPILAGRKILIGEFEQAFSLNPNDPNLCSLFSGPRGVGKTVLMSHLARKAEANGWISANVTARPACSKIFSKERWMRQTSSLKDLRLSD